MTYDVERVWSELLRRPDFENRSAPDLASVRYLVERIGAAIAPIADKPLDLESLADAKARVARLFQDPGYERLLDAWIAGLGVADAEARQRGYRTSLAQSVSTIENALTAIREKRIHSDVTASRLQRLFTRFKAEHADAASMTVGTFAQGYAKYLL